MQQHSAGCNGNVTADQMISNIIDKNEGGGDRVISDINGIAKYGINSGANPGVDIRHLTRDNAIEIYKKNYVAKIKGFDELSPQMQMIALDTAINQGVGYANKFVSRSGGDVEKMDNLRLDRYKLSSYSNPEKYGSSLAGWEIE